MVALCRGQAFRSGVSALIADEFQFATQGSAHARVTQLLLSLGYIGLPTVYVANFSLLHRLAKRPQEDQHRLVSDPLFLFPESSGSQGWIETLRMMKTVAPDCFVFSIDKHADQIHKYTFGINRNLVKLLVCAYRISRQNNSAIGLPELDTAFKHHKYSAFRRDVEDLVKQHITGQPVRGRQDLWSPIEMPRSMQAELTAKLIQRRDKTVAEKKLESSMTAEEFAAHRRLVVLDDKNSHPSSASVLPLKRRHKESAAELTENTAEAFRDLF